jgi:hypothetical protein
VPKSQPKSNSEEATTTTLTPDKREAIKKEIAKLLVAGFINEVYHTEWLANPVLVLKKNINE